MDRSKMWPRTAIIALGLLSIQGANLRAYACYVPKSFYIEDNEQIADTIEYLYCVNEELEIRIRSLELSLPLLEAEQRDLRVADFKNYLQELKKITPPETTVAISGEDKSDRNEKRIDEIERKLNDFNPFRFPFESTDHFWWDSREPQAPH